MKQLLDNKNRIGALMAIVALAVVSVSIVGIGTTHMAKADQVGKVCVFFACGKANITGGTTSSGGGGGGGQPTPSTATLIVTKECAPANVPCRPEGFTITVSGNNPSPASFPGSATGTQVTLDPGVYSVDETPPVGFSVSFTGDCKNININAGETKKCTVTNRQEQTTATLTVFKQVVCPAGTACKMPSDFLIKVIATNASPSTPFQGDAITGTKVTLDAGSFTVQETGTQPGYVVTFKDDCAPNGSGNINAGQSLKCTVVNTLTAAGAG